MSITCWIYYILYKSSIRAEVRSSRLSMSAIVKQFEWDLALLISRVSLDKVTWIGKTVIKTMFILGSNHENTMPIPKLNIDIYGNLICNYTHPIEIACIVDRKLELCSRCGQERLPAINLPPSVFNLTTPVGDNRGWRNATAIYKLEIIVSPSAGNINVFSFPTSVTYKV